MASGIFALLDDIAALMDDVAVTAKLATKKTAAILGDDLAVNAEKATGFLSSREIPVLWSITKGSFVNKIIIVPIVILLNIFLSEVIKYILIAGGFYLAYEGVEKIIHFIFHRNKKGHEVIAEREENPQAVEKQKIQSAITTDFILSIEIVIIALTSIDADASLLVKILTVCIVAMVATIGVYGIVALLVRMDDAGFKLIKASDDKGFSAKIGHLLVNALPVVIKLLGIIGTIALLLVSGGIFDHNIDYLHHQLPNFPETVKQLLYGIVAGVIAVIIITPLVKIFGNKKTADTH